MSGVRTGSCPISDRVPAYPEYFGLGYGRGCLSPRSGVWYLGPRSVRDHGLDGNMWVQNPGTVVVLLGYRSPRSVWDRDPIENSWVRGPVGGTGVRSPNDVSKM